MHTLSLFCVHLMVCLAPNCALCLIPLFLFLICDTLHVHALGEGGGRERGRGREEERERERKKHPLQVLAIPRSQFSSTNLGYLHECPTYVKLTGLGIQMDHHVDSSSLKQSVTAAPWSWPPLLFYC